MAAPRHADPIGRLLDVLHRQARRSAPVGPMMATVVSLDPLTIELDTGQVIPNPVVLTTTEPPPEGSS